MPRPGRTSGSPHDGTILVVTTASTPRLGPAADAEDAYRRIRSEGGRVTAAKRRVVELLYADSQARTADELVETLDGVDPSVVYRTLGQLEDLGIAEHVHLGHGRAVYRRRGLDTVPVACLNCGRSVEIDVSEVEPLRVRIQAVTGIRIDLVHFPLTGRCETCRAESDT